MVRFAGLLRAATAVFLFVSFSAGAGAQDRSESAAAPVVVEQPADSIQQAPAVQLTITPRVASVERRPAALVPLYASFATLQVLDLHSTSYALAHGGVEANPTVKGLAGNTVAMAAVKAAGTAGVIYVSERLRKKNKAAAIGLMIATNATMTWVVQHNYRLAR